ncbi:MAG: SulP family inorganic anion transporter [Candidatus Eisenbacteria bacterium]|nr:SulP family inorganic anion transporter [Candidatus Eisenbacteria bacterium]
MPAARERSFGGLNREAFQARLPRLVESLRHYDARTFLRDLVAGVTVGLVALPLAMAFAISSGVSPQAGIYTAVVAGFLISALGGSRVQIGGPTGAFVVVVFGIIAKHGLDGLFMCTLMAGALLVVMGVTGMGAAVKYLPRSVVIGFTNGIALLIASTQIKDFFGLRIDRVSGVFMPRLLEIGRGLHTLSPQATALGVGALVLLIVCQKFFRHVPGTILALVAGTLAVHLLRLPVETIGSRFGGIPAGLPPFHVPPFRPEMIHPLLSPALTVAMLGAIESLMSATVADRMTGDRHNPNVELVAQGLANLFSPLVGGLPATGAIARTATNIRSGAKTPIAGIVHALTLLAILIFAAPLARDVPIAVLSGILLVVAYNMGAWDEIRDLLKLSKTDISVWLATFALTVFADLTVAVETGMIMAALLTIRKVAVTTSVIEETDEEVEAGRIHILQDKEVPDYAVVYRIHGPLLFGSVDKLRSIAHGLGQLPPIVILRLRNMTAIDGTGVGALEDLADELHASGRTLILCGAREQPARLMTQAEFHDHIGHANICDDIEKALERATVVYAEQASRSSAATDEA